MFQVHQLGNADGAKNFVQAARECRFVRVLHFEIFYFKPVSYPKMYSTLCYKEVLTVLHDLEFAGRGRKPRLSPRMAWKLYCEVYIKRKVVLKDIAKVWIESVDKMRVSRSTRTIQRGLNRNRLCENLAGRTSLHKPCHILPKRSWTKKIAFGNTSYSMIKEKWSFLDIMMYRRCGARKVKLTLQITQCQH